MKLKLSLGLLIFVSLFLFKASTSPGKVFAQYYSESAYYSQGTYYSQAAYAPPPVTVSGRITNSTTGAGIPGVVVNQGSNPCGQLGTATTDANGNFSYANVAVGTIFCLRPPALANYSGPSATAGNYPGATSYECQTAGEYHDPDICGWGFGPGGNGLGPTHDFAADNTFNFTYTPVPPSNLTVSGCATSTDSSGLTFSWSGTSAGWWINIYTNTGAMPNGQAANKQISGTSTNGSGFSWFNGQTGFIPGQTIYWNIWYGGSSFVYYGGSASPPGQAFTVPVCSAPVQPSNLTVSGCVTSTDSSGLTFSWIGTSAGWWINIYTNTGTMPNGQAANKAINGTSTPGSGFNWFNGQTGFIPGQTIYWNIWYGGTNFEYPPNSASPPGQSFVVNQCTGTIRGRFWTDTNSSGGWDWPAEKLVETTSTNCAGSFVPYVQVDASVSYSGPGGGGNVPVNLCGPDPYYTTPSLSVGMYSVSPLVPIGWQVVSAAGCTLVGASCSVNVPVGPIDVWFGIIPAPPSPWLQTSKGDVGSRADTNLSVPAGKVNGDYLSIATGSNLFASAKTWLVSSYGNFKPSSPYGYTELYNKFGAVSCALAGSTVPNTNGAYLVTGDFAPTTTPSGGTACGSTTKNATVVFVTGNLNITTNFNAGPVRPVVFIVAGNINVSTGVTSVNAALIANGSFTDIFGGGSANQQLLIGGAVMAGLNGSSSLTFGRDMGANNTTTPAEKITLDPQYLYLLSDLLGETKSFTQEVAP